MPQWAGDELAPWLYVVFVVLELFFMIDEVVESKVWLALRWCVPTTAARSGGRTGDRA